MPDLTTNHGLQLWAAGELDWEHRADMQSIERTLTVRDFDANHANYTPYDGARFEATDTNAIYLGDGTAWNAITPKPTADHIADTTNPHSVTAAQASALPDTGGTVSGSVTISNDLSIGGTIDGGRTTVNVTTDHTTADGEIVIADASSAAITVTLPSTADAVVDVKVADATNSVTIATPNTETIDGQTNEVLDTQYQSRTIAFDGTDYWII